MSADQPIPSTRTKTPDGAKVCSLRMDRGWSVEEFARRAGCSTKTIKAVETGASVYLATIGKIADALDLEPKELFAADSPSDAPQPTSTSRRVHITAQFAVDFDALDESSDLHALLKFLRKWFDGRGDIDITEISPGSVLIGLEIDEPEAYEFLRRFCYGDSPKTLEQIVCAADQDLENVVRAAVQTLQPVPTSVIASEDRRPMMGRSRAFMIVSPEFEDVLPAVGRSRTFVVASSEHACVFLIVSRVENKLVLTMRTLALPSPIAARRKRQE